MGTKIAFRRPDGKQAAGYLAKAGRAKAPGVVVIQEWWGLQDQIKGICDRFALAGYEALAPDLYAGTVVPYHDTEAAGREMNSLNFLEATDQVVRGAAQLLQRTGVKVGLTGFCLGGAWAPAGSLSSPPRSASMGCRRRRSPSPPTSRCRCRPTSPTATTGARRKPSTSSRPGSRPPARRPRCSATMPTTASSTSSAMRTIARPPSWRGSEPWHFGRRIWAAGDPPCPIPTMS